DLHMDDKSHKRDVRRSPRKHSSSSQSSSTNSESDDQPRPDPTDDVFADGDINDTPRARVNQAFADDGQQRERRVPILLPPTNLSLSFTRTLSAAQPSLGSTSRTGSSITSRTRSTSPVKNPDNLLKLGKPVKWENAAPGVIKKKVQQTGSIAALSLWTNIWNVVGGGSGYLPRELKDLLQDELQAFDYQFASEDRIVNLDAQQQDDASQIFMPFTDNIKHEMSLYNELSTIRSIVAESTDFIKWSRAEAAWNDHIHGPTLRLAVSTIPHIQAENITTATIHKDFLPSWKGEEIDISKMIDYTLLLSPDTELSNNIESFIDTLKGPNTFNQSTSEHLRYKPTGVFIETKTDMKRYPEGKVQLGIWLAAWYARTSQFATVKIPLMPVLLVVCAKWELHFALDQGSHYEVVGPVDIGGTGTVEDMYRLLAVLRLLGNWVGSEFREWVRQCVE
ncbi:hypothetical protein ACHAPA_012322, partial [Fusarium lateritium]